MLRSKSIQGVQKDFIFFDTNIACHLQRAWTILNAKPNHICCPAHMTPNNSFFSFNTCTMDFVLLITHCCNFPHLDVLMHLGFLEPLTYELILFMNKKKCKKDKNILWAEFLLQTFLIGCHLTAGLLQVFNFCRNTK